MNVTKTVQGGVVNLTNVKRHLLNREYENLQKYLHGSEDVTLHSANKQQADCYYEKIKEEKEYPLSICSRCGKMGKRNKGLFKCPHCGLELDADVNGAWNIGKRACGKSEIRPLVRVGAVVTQPELRSYVPTAGAFWRHVASGGEPHSLLLEAQHFSGGRMSPG